jgi:hypothetical protein
MGPLLLGYNQFNSATRHPEFYGPSASDAVMDRIEASMTTGRHATFHNPDREVSESASDEILGPMISNVGSTNISFGSLPPKSVVDQYVQRFFTTTHRLYPILEERTFWLRYSQFWVETGSQKSDSLWLSLLYMMLALGHQLAATDTNSRLEQRLNLDNHGSMYFMLAKSSFADLFFSGGNILAVRCMFLGV